VIYKDFEDDYNGIRFQIQRRCMSTALRLFSKHEVEKFKSDLMRLKVKRKIASRAFSLASIYVFATHDNPAYIHCSKFGVIGRVNEDAFPMWIKRNLFKEVDSKYSPGVKCKGYIVDKEFYLYLKNTLSKEEINIINDTEHQANISATKELYKTYKQELNALKPIEYTEGNDGRYHHILQGVKRELKSKIIFKDFNDYDISSAAPTILYQLYHNICKKYNIQYNRFNELATIEYYINNKVEVRKDFALQYNIDEEIAKKILNSFFNKAKLAANNHCVIYTKYLEFDKTKLLKMQQDPFIKTLRRDIGFLWNKIYSVMNEEVVKRPNKVKRWYLYFAEERKILAVIDKELAKLTGTKNLGYFLEHDGMKVHKRYQLDVDNLIEKIYSETGYILDISNK